MNTRTWRQRGIAMIAVSLVLTGGCNGRASELESDQVPGSSIYAASPTTSLTTTTTTIPTTTSPFESTSSTESMLHQWGQIDGFVACPEYLQAVITNDKPGELRLVWVLVYFPDQPEWQEWAVSWDDPDQLLPLVSRDDSAIWRVSPGDVGRQSAFSPGEYRVMISTEFNPDPDWGNLSKDIGSEIEASFVDGTLPSSECG